MSTFAVLGATGRVGGATAHALLKRGHAVRALTRNPDSVASVKFRPWVYHPLSAMLYQVFAAMLYHDLSAMLYHL
jgi:nucleoside-diphosphate-sugar epimerase